MIITVANFKGGVGKTTTTFLFSYLLSKRNKKVLAIDTDPQRNFTDSLSKTFNVEIDITRNIYKACFGVKGTKENIQTINSNLDILSGTWDMVDFELAAKDHYTNLAFPFILSNTLEEITNDYDYILIDTAPTTNLVMKNTIVATDYVLIATQTVPLAFESTKRFYEYLEQVNTLNDNFELLGILPYLVGKSATDNRFLDKYTEYFGEDLFDNIIKSSDRVKTWSAEGITDDRPYDKKTLTMYENVLNEALNKIQLVIGE